MFLCGDRGPILDIYTNFCRTYSLLRRRRNINCVSESTISCWLRYCVQLHKLSHTAQYKAPLRLARMAYVHCENCKSRWIPNKGRKPTICESAKNRTRQSSFSISMVSILERPAPFACTWVWQCRTCFWKIWKSLAHRKSQIFRFSDFAFSGKKSSTTFFLVF